MSRLLHNKCKCKKCGDIIESKYRHDYVTCKCGSVSTDGGIDYVRRSWPTGDPNDWIEDLDEYSDQ